MKTNLPHRIRRLIVALGMLGASIAATAVVTAATAGVASASTATFTSTQIGSSGQTPQFTESGNWQMAWSYNCSNFGSSGNFTVTVNQPSNSTVFDIGPNQLGMSGSGTDSYTDTGTFSLSVSSECNWSISVSSNTTGPVGGGATFTSTQIGSSGQTPQFTESGNWQMAWSYNCSNFGSSGNFTVTVNQPSNSTVFDIGPNQLGMSGSGTDSYTDTGTFSLSVSSECNWSISVSSNTTGPVGGGATFTSTQIGSSGQTPQFTESGNWQMA
ncbi:MAG: hypothetical protein ACP5O0_11525, partial [Acidimicrobiales bacterium]